MVQGKWLAVNRALEKFAYQVTVWCGSSWAFLVATLMVFSWLLSGPIFRFSDTWQLVMNTVSSVVTFLMVFLLQRSQNKDALAMHIKLDELIAAMRGASNRVINVEALTEQEVRELHGRYRMIAEKARHAVNGTESVSTEKVPP